MFYCFRQFCKALLRQNRSEKMGVLHQSQWITMVTNLSRLEFIFCYIFGLNTPPQIISEISKYQTHRYQELELRGCREDHCRIPELVPRL